MEVRRSVNKGLLRNRGTWYLQFGTIILIFILLAPQVYALPLTSAQKRALSSGVRYCNTETDTCSLGGGTTQEPTTATPGKSYVLVDSLAAGVQQKIETAVTTAGYTPHVNGKGSGRL